MAQTDILTSLNLNKNELQNAVMQNLAASPDTPKKGQVYFDTATNKEKYFNGTEWVDSVSTEEMNEALDGKVDKVSGKGLSANDFTSAYKQRVDQAWDIRHSHENKDILDGTSESFTTALKDDLDSNTSARHTHSNKTVLDGTSASYTTEEKTKLSGIAAGAQVNVVETVKVNNTALTPSAKAVNITVPTKTSQLTNDSGFATQTYVTQQIGAIDKLKKSVVEALPTSSIDTNTIYLVPKSTSESGNVYNEYMYINSAWELIGDTKTDLTGYAKKQTYQNPALTPSGGAVTWTVTHSLNSQDICAALRRVSDNAQILAEIIFTSATQVTVKLNADSNVAANAYKLVLVG